MIKTILLVISIIILLALIGLTVWKGVQFGTSKDDGENAIRRKYEKQMSENYFSHAKLAQITKEMNTELKEYRKNNKSNRKGRLGFLILLPITISVLAFTVLVPSSFHQVEAGTVAVVKKLGKIIDVKTPGTHFDFYMTKDYDIYDTTVQQLEIRTAAYSHDAQTMDLELYLQYQIQLDKLIIKDDNGNILQTEGIAGKYVTLASLEARIKTQTIEKSKAVMSAAHFYEPDPETGEYPENDFAMRGEEIIRHRAEVSKKVSDVVRSAIGDDFYVNVHDVVLTNIDFTDEFERSVEAKVIAEQEKIAAETKAAAEAEVAKIKAEAEKAVAEIEAQKKVIEAEADAEVVRIRAEAEARATVAKIIELARTVGFTVIETETGYIIEFDDIHTPEMFESIVEEYLEYLAYLEQWNGELPSVVAGDDAISIIVPNN